MNAKMPIPGEVWYPRDDAPDLDIIPVAIYVTGVDMDKGLVFGIPRHFQYEGASLSWYVGFFAQYMEKR